MNRVTQFRNQVRAVGLWLVGTYASFQEGRNKRSFNDMAIDRFIMSARVGLQVVSASIECIQLELIVKGPTPAGAHGGREPTSVVSDGT